MAKKCAPIDRAGRGPASAKLDELAMATVGVNESVRPTVKHVIGLDGRRLSLADLPLPDTKRWVIRRKAAVVAAVRGGLLSLEEACCRYALNSDEVLSWERCIDHFGLAGLRTTWTQIYLKKYREVGDFENSAEAVGVGANYRELGPQTMLISDVERPRET
jgi:hypothetical protein